MGLEPLGEEKAMSIEMCPRCRTLVNTRDATSETRAAARGEPKHLIIRRSFHCTRCSTFIRSEVVEEEVPATEKH